MAIVLFFLYLIFSLVVIARGTNPRVWEIGSAIYLIIATFIVGMHWSIDIILWFLIVAIIVTMNMPSIRTKISAILYKRAVKAIPKLSKTEEEALNAGDAWLEEDIFKGRPDWEKLSHITTALNEEEQSFLTHETETLCSMLNEWDIAQAQDLPEDVWRFLKEQGFLGLVIDKKYGGKGFSARAHSDIVVKVASRSIVGAVTVMVPNSLGPGELLQHYGTEEQKTYYLPRLAKGIDIPCFALTEPGAGSDATSLESKGIVVEKEINGEKVLGLSISLNKRWITLAPVATLIGLAIYLKDPNGLLAGVGSEGITCLLMPRDTENLEIGNRHLPAGQPFMNGTIRGENLFVPLENIIGGQKMAGRGWQMLVECLSIGRSISLPGLASAFSSIAYLTSGAFAKIRRQFKVEIANFEGIEEKLAEIGGLNYLIQSTRLLTLAAVNEQKKPSVASAMTKYFNTELGRITIINAMDIHAGRAVVSGPRNYLANAYQGLPISITVEGANIMSRNLLIFGQGSMVCHPYIREEFYATANNEQARFHELMWEHIHYFVRNFAKAVCSAWTGGLFISVPKSPMKKEYKRLVRLSQAYAWFADLALIYLGGSLKRKERLSARLADGLSYLYMAMAALRLAEQHEFHADYQVHAKWAVGYCFYHAQKAMLDICQNFPSKILGALVKFFIFPGGQSIQYPSDKLDHQLAQLMTQNNQYRIDLKKAIYITEDSTEPLAKMENAFQLLQIHAPIYIKVPELKRLPFGEMKAFLQEKLQQGVLSASECEALMTLEKARWDAIQVDEFEFNSTRNQIFSSVIDLIKTPFD